MTSREDWPPELEDGHYWVKLFGGDWIVILLEEDKVWFLGDEDYHTLAGLDTTIHQIGPKIEEPK